MNRYAKPTNFASRVRTPLLREHFVYRAFDADGQLLYIGCTLNPIKRLSEHRQHSAWHRYMKRLTFVGPYNYETARQVEYDAIEGERSLYNFSSERRELKKLRDRLIDFCIQQMVEQGVPQAGAIAGGVDLGRALLPDGDSAGPVLVDDTTVPRARKFVADYIRGEVAA